MTAFGGDGFDRAPDQSFDKGEQMLFGADSHALRLLAGKLEQISSRLSTIETSVNRRVESMNWQGPDAERFRGTWTGTSAPSMRDASTTLRGAAEAIRGDAQRQDQVSGT